VSLEVPIDDLYREVVLDHHRQPRGRAPLDRVDAEAEGLNPSCGDELNLRLKLDGQRVVEAQVDARGCAISTASGSMLAELVVGRTATEAHELAASFRAAVHGEEPADPSALGDLEALLGVRKFPLRVKCALLAWVTLEDALQRSDEQES